MQNAVDVGPPKAETKLTSSLTAALARPERWSSLAVALNMLGQLGLLFATGKWPPQPSSANTMRGIDFYPWKDFIRALIRSARTFKVENGYLPSLVSPTSFNEHIFARRFFAEIPIPSLADKLAAKDFVRARLGDEFLPVVAWIGDSVDGLFGAKLSAGRYVLKANHGCEWNLVLNLPEDFSARRTEIQQLATTWLMSRYGYDWGEWQYSVFKPKLFLEEFIDFKGAQTPDDYKFYCFRGKVCLIELDVDRFTQLRSALYTPDWKYIPVNYGEEPIHRARPGNLEDMVRVAEMIARDMEFIRVDLYSDGNSKIKFGEITSFPGNGTLHFSDLKFDRWLGSHFRKAPESNAPLSRG
jgi:hypothetical protein